MKKIHFFIPMFLLLLFPASTNLFADQTGFLQKVIPDTMFLPPFSGDSILFPELPIDSAFLRSADSTFKSCTTIKAAYKKFKKILPTAAEKRLTAQLFVTFLGSGPMRRLHTDSLGFRWYCKKWRNDALSARTDFLRMCYSDCLHENGKFGPLASPIVDTSSLDSCGTVRVGLFLRDRRAKVKYSYELARQAGDFESKTAAFIAQCKKTLVADSAHWFTSVKIEGGGLYRLTMYTPDNFRVFYFRYGALSGIAQCDNRTLLVHGFSPSGRLPPPYHLYIWSGRVFMQATTDSLGTKALSFREFPDSTIDLRVSIEKNGVIAPIRVSRGVFDERYKINSYVYCDRTWYRPGDTVHIGGMVKNFTDGARFSRAPVDSVRLELTSNFTKKTTVSAVRVDSLGHFFDSLILPGNARLEEYKVKVLLPPKSNYIEPRNTQTSFEVTTFKKPSCKVSISIGKERYSPHDTVNAAIAARYFLGAPVRYAYGGLLGFYSPEALDTIITDPRKPCYRYRDTGYGETPYPWLYAKDTIWDKNGNLVLNYPVDALPENGFYTLQASVQGADKRFYGCTRKFFVVKDTPFVHVFTRTVPHPKTAELFVSCFVTDPNGFPCRASVACSVTCNNSTLHFYQSNECDTRGVARFRFKELLPHKSYRAACIVNPSRPDARHIAVDIDIPRGDDRGGDTSQYLIVNQTRCRRGDTVYATIDFPCDSSPVLFTAGSTGMQWYRTALSGGPLVVPLPLAQGAGSVLFLAAACYDRSSGSLLTSRRQITIGPDSSFLLHVNLSSPRAVRPGDSCSLNLTVSDAAGRPAGAAFSAAVVDEAVFSLRPERDSGALKALSSTNYRYPCSTYCSTDLDVRENLRGLESLGRRLILNRGKPRATKMKQRFGIEQLVEMYDSRSILDNARWKWMVDGWKSRRAGIGEGYGYGSGGVDDLIGNLMGGDGGGSLELKKRGSLRLNAPDFLKGGSYPSLKKPVPVREYFRDQACWIPSVVAANGGKASFKFRLPDNLTQWRIRLRGSGNDSCLIDFRDSLIANNPLMIQLETPQFLIRNDSTIIHAVVFNNTGETVSAQARLEATRGARIAGDLQKNITLDPDASAAIEWPVTTLGADTAVLIASITTPIAADAEKRKIPLLPFACEMVTGASALVHDSCSLRLDPTGDALPGTQRLTVFTANNGITALLPALRYCMEFPHGCVEQTMDRFLPDLYVATLLAENNIKNQELDSLCATYAAAGLKLLAGYQHADGGWGWWQHDATSEKMTALVVRGLYLADKTRLNETGKKQIAAMLDRGVPRLCAMIDSCKGDPVAALPLITNLAEAPHLEKYRALVETLVRNPGSLTFRQCADLLACTRALGLNSAEPMLVNRLVKLAHNAGSKLWWPDEGNGKRAMEIDASAIHATAAAINAIAITQPNHPSIEPALAWLFSKNDGQKWISTATTAEVIRAISRCSTFGRTGRDKTASTLRVVVNGKPYTVQVTSGYGRINTGNIIDIGDSALARQNNVTFIVPGGAPVFCAARLSYLRRVPTAPDSQRPLRVNRVYLRVDRLGKNEIVKRPMEGACASGDEIETSLELNATQPCSYLMVEDPLPAGMEAIIPEDPAPPAGVAHIEYFPDRVVFYLNSLPVADMRLCYRMRAIFPGVYQALPAHAEAMYAPEIQGYSRGEQVKITR
jgi:hypothetical protein